MNNAAISSSNDDPALEWLFSKARSYPLLSKADEQSIDAEKWRALHALLELIASDPHGRQYLALWADNLLNNPPDLEHFKVKEHYYLLRREQSAYQKQPALQRLLRQIAKGSAAAITAAINSDDFELDSTLTVGFAEVLLQHSPASGLRSALEYWQQFWPQAPLSGADLLDPATAQAMGEEIRAYYDARTRLVNHNLRLVFSIAGKVPRRQAYRDHIQDGVIGLIRAAEKFRSSRGFRFSTYAYNWIMQGCRRGNEEMGAIIRFPAHVAEQITAIQRERAAHYNRWGQAPSRASLAESLELSVDELENLEMLDNRTVSTEAQVAGEDSRLSMGDMLTDESAPATDVDAEQDAMRRLVRERLQVLKPQERQVIVRRWGLDRMPAATRKDLALQMDVSPEWVRQLESAALKKLGNDSVLAAIGRESAAG